MPHPDDPRTTSLSVASATPRINSNSNLRPQRKIRVHRACDLCRKRKTRCESPQTSDAGGKCPSCIQGGDYSVSKKSCSSRQHLTLRLAGYVTMLRENIGRLESMLRQLHPSLDLEAMSAHLKCEDSVYDTYLQELRSRNVPPYPALRTLPLPTVSTRPTPSLHPPAAIHGSGQDVHAEDEIGKDNPSQVVLIDSVRWLKIRDVRDTHWRYHRKSSGAHMVMQIQDWKSR
ncbi:hypothetical protein IAR50_006282 [Cryptococcus sp. DSM 104548]